MIKSENETWGSFLLELLILILVVLFIRFYVFQFFRVSGPSMCPTLNFLDEKCRENAGEFLFVNEILYQFRAPKRGEIVVFHPPHKRVFYVKRVIGVPGDRVEVVNGKVYLENQKEGIARHELPENYLSEKNQGHTESALESFEVPEGHFLVFGDNRTRSLDARQCFQNCNNEEFSPFVPRRNFAGRAEFVVWPFWTARNLDNEPKFQP